MFHSHTFTYGRIHWGCRQILFGYEQITPSEQRSTTSILLILNLSKTNCALFFDKFRYVVQILSYFVYSVSNLDNFCLLPL